MSIRLTLKKNKCAAGKNTLGWESRGWSCPRSVTSLLWEPKKADSILSGQWAGGAGASRPRPYATSQLPHLGVRAWSSAQTAILSLTDHYLRLSSAEETNLSISFYILRETFVYQFEKHKKEGSEIKERLPRYFWILLWNIWVPPVSLFLPPLSLSFLFVFFFPSLPLSLHSLSIKITTGETVRCISVFHALVSHYVSDDFFWKGFCG